MAFPQSMSATGPYGGMELRDWFAGHIAGAAVASGVPFEPKALARDSFMLADAMLAEREKRS